MKVWVDGRLMAQAEASIPVMDHGFTVGDGVFETLKTVEAPAVGVVPFAMDRHIQRLRASAAGMKLPDPDPGQVRDALLAVCVANPGLAAGGRIRVTLTSGPGPIGSDRTQCEPTLAVTAATAPSWPDSTSLALSPWPRNERSPLVGLKTTSYAENVLALARAKSVGAGEALLTNLAGLVCEGTGSNVFLVEDGRVRTPALSSGCLAGITRALVIDWGRDHGFDVVAGEVSLAEVLAADEVFITSSTRDVHPVTTILGDDGAPRWERPVGEVTRGIAAVFADCAGADWNP